MIVLRLLRKPHVDSCRTHGMISRINDDDLIKLINQNRRYYILDARDEDRNGGHIPKSIHIPDQMDYNKKMQLLNSLLQNIKIDQKNNDNETIWIVIHCMESICRGPRLASLIIDLLSQKSDINTKQIKTCVLNGGADNWIRKYHLNKSLVQNFDDEYWGFYIHVKYSPIPIKIQELINYIDEYLRET